MTPTETARRDIVNIAAPELGADVEALVLQVLRSGHLAQGPMVKRFEALCAAMAGTSQAVAVANGTVALELALEASGVGPGDEVITSPMTFAATLNAILHRGAVARFVDVADDYTLDPKAVAAAVNERTRAVMPVHLYGLMSDMEAIAAIASERDLSVIEDAAQAHGASQNGRQAGSFGVGSFSFYATKNITSAEGGVLTTSDAALADTMRVLRNQGMRDRYDYVAVGHNFRLSDVAAAIAVPQLQRIAEIIAARDDNATYLTTMIGADLDLVLPSVPLGRTHVWHHYTVLLPATASREDVIRRMAAEGVVAGAYYPQLVWDYQPYRDHSRVIRGHTPRAEDAARRCLSIPVHPGVSRVGLERVAAALRNAITTGVTRSAKQ